MGMILDGHTGIEHTTPVAPLYEDVIQLFAASKTAYNPTLVVGYGGIWNPAKDRYCDSENRGKVYLLQLYGNALQYRLAGDRLSRWAFKVYFGGRFAGASGETVVVSRRP